MSEPDAYEDVEPTPPRLKNLREAMECLKDVRSFIELNSYTAEATKAEELVNKVAWLQCNVQGTVQSKLTNHNLTTEDLLTTLIITNILPLTNISTKL